MIIGGSPGGSGVAIGSDPRKAQIQRQIRELESERRQLQKQLGKAMKAQGGGASSGAAKGAKPVASTPAAATTTQKRHIPEAIRETMPNYDIQALAAEYSNPAMSSQAVAAGGAVVRMTENISGIYASGDETSEEVALDSEQIMEKLELIELQIMTLQMRLGDDGKSVLSMDSSEDGEQPDVASPAGAAAGEEALSPPVVTDDGRVDGYA